MIFTSRLIELPPDHNGVFIDKLYLEAAHWNGICIEEQLTNISREIMPTIHLKVKSNLRDKLLKNISHFFFL